MSLDTPAHNRFAPIDMTYKLLIIFHHCSFAELCIEFYHQQDHSQEWHLGHRCNSYCHMDKEAEVILYPMLIILY